MTRKELTRREKKDEPARAVHRRCEIRSDDRPPQPRHRQATTGRDGRWRMPAGDERTTMMGDTSVDMVQKARRILNSDSHATWFHRILPSPFDAHLIDHDFLNNNNNDARSACKSLTTTQPDSSLHTDAAGSRDVLSVKSIIAGSRRFAFFAPSGWRFSLSSPHTRRHTLSLFQPTH